MGRAVLIEDFTGQKCVNCPNGTTLINDIVETYGEDNVIAVGIHSGPLSKDGEDGLATETGNDYYRNSDSQQAWTAVGSLQSCNKATSQEMSTRGHNM